MLFTFALGTAAGDLSPSASSLGYALAVGLFATAIAAVAVAHYRFALNAVAAFWSPTSSPVRSARRSATTSRSRAATAAWVSARPSRASLFLGTILVVVVFLTLTRRDVTEGAELGDPPLTRILVVRTARRP